VTSARAKLAEGTATHAPRAAGLIAEAPGRPADSPAGVVLDAVLADSDNGVLLLDCDRRVREANPAALALLGWTRARAVGRPGEDLIRPLVPGESPVIEGFRRERTDLETVLVGAGGGELPVWLRTYRLPRGGGVLVTLRDLSQIRRMREELRRNERLALIGQLAAGVAHEIRNPLAGIGTSAQVLLRRFEPRDERARFVSVILEEVARLDRIVTSLLQYSRPRTPELVRAELAPLVRHVIELLRESTEPARIEVQVHAPSRLGPVFVDPDLVTQVLLNVSLNAIQAMPQGGLLRYELRRVRRRPPPRGPGRRATDPRRPGARPSPGPWMEHQQVRITDTGAGMPRGVLAKLFQPFFTTRPRGTGLGLSICQTIMHEHDGSIEIASREGRGTTVMLNFPLEKRHGERREPHANAGRADAARR
jgi:two-component system sensor histidine kinase HydH